MVSERIIKNTGFLYLRMGISTFILLYTTRIVLNSLGETDFGIFNIIGGVITMLAFLNASMAAATQRYMSYCEGEGNLLKLSKIFNNSLILHLLTALICIIAFSIAYYFIFNGILNIPQDRIHAAKIIYLSLLISTFFTIIGVPYDAAINAHENMKFYAIVGIIESILKLIVAFVTVITSHDKLITYGALMAIIPLITLLLMTIYCTYYYTECKIHIIRLWDKSIFIEITKFAGWNFLGTTSSMIGNYGIGIVLNHFHGAILNAAQGIATQLSGQLMAFSRNMLKAITPIIAKSEGGGNRDMMLKASLTGCKFSFFIFAFFCIPAIIEMPYILKVWLQLQLVRTLIEQTSITFSSSIAAEGHIKEYNKWISVVNLMPIIIIYILFSNGHSPVVMYIVNIIVYGIIYSLVSLYYMNKNCGLSYRHFFVQVLSPIFLSIIAPIIIGYIPTFVMEEGIIRLCVVCILISTTYIIFTIILGLNPEEKALLSHYIHQVTTKKINHKCPVKIGTS